jgi:hypothetical protein
MNTNASSAETRVPSGEMRSEVDPRVALGTTQVSVAPLTLVAGTTTPSKRHEALESRVAFATVMTSGVFGCATSGVMDAIVPAPAGQRSVSASQRSRLLPRKVMETPSAVASVMSVTTSRATVICRVTSGQRHTTVASSTRVAGASTEPLKRHTNVR